MRLLRLARVRLSPDVLGRLLRLPSDTRVVGAWVSRDTNPEIIWITIEGLQCPLVSEGEVIPELELTGHLGEAPRVAGLWGSWV